MARPLSWALAALLFLAAPAVGAAELCSQQPQRAAQPAGKADRPGDGHGPAKRWWIDQPMRGDLGITDQQSAAVEKIWQSSLPSLRESRQKLDKLEEALTQMTRDDSIDEALVVAQIERVENMRADANKRRTLMIYRMNKVLTPDQRAKVKAMFEQRDQGRRGSSSR
jgi:Spy/CpxP family protein refolding chaperone